jgi:hypothetical protein
MERIMSTENPRITLAELPAIIAAAAELASRCEANASPARIQEAQSGKPDGRHGLLDLLHPLYIRPLTDAIELPHRQKLQLVRLWKVANDISLPFDPTLQAKLISVVRKIASADSGRTTVSPETHDCSTPKQLLSGWHAITTALGMKYREREDVKRLNAAYQGPIVNNGQGTRPKVYKENLIRWWNGLALKQQELANQREGARLSAQAQHFYGRDGIVAPEISGGIKKRRSRST